MAYGLIYEFPSSVGAQEYHAVNEKLGIDSDDPKSEWPEGLLTHTSGKTSDGVFWLYEVWESKADHERFMQEHVIPMMPPNAPQPSMDEFEVYSRQTKNQMIA